MSDRKSILYLRQLVIDNDRICHFSSKIGTLGREGTVKAMCLQSQSPEISFSRRIAFGYVCRRRLDFLCDDTREVRILLRYVVGVFERMNDFVRQVGDRRKPDESGNDEQQDEHPEPDAKYTSDAVVTKGGIESHGWPTSDVAVGATATRAPPDVSCPETTCATRKPIPIGSPCALK